MWSKVKTVFSIIGAVLTVVFLSVIPVLLCGKEDKSDGSGSDRIDESAGRIREGLDRSEERIADSQERIRRAKEILRKAVERAGKEEQETESK